MMKAADSRQSQRLAWFNRPLCNQPPFRRCLLQANMRSILAIVGDVGTPKSSEMLTVQGNDVIKHFPANAADPAFRRPVLPRTAYTGANRFDATGLQKGDHL